MVGIKFGAPSDGENDWYGSLQQPKVGYIWQQQKRTKHHNNKTYDKMYNNETYDEALHQRNTTQFTIKFPFYFIRGLNTSDRRSNSSLA